MSGLRAKSCTQSSIGRANIGVPDNKRHLLTLLAMFFTYIDLFDSCDLRA